MKHRADGRAAAVALALGLMPAGCATRTHLAPVDLAAPGWSVTETAAAWRPRTGAPEFVGELTVAKHSAGSCWVQFSKQGLPVVTAQLATNGWQISSALRAGVFLGRLPPPRALWFQIDGAPPLRPPQPPWHLATNSGNWRLTNDRTGESLEGAFN
ncbi:MAG TPA: hypothetical protein PLX89_21815 [Verrucomicrobiota bacterium]|nr:hypothetical protein [Verrucomicrobiales bacterium]HRI15642.1 hypothetical protein [Verrucomicrobiota bacterium]